MAAARGDTLIVRSATGDPVQAVLKLLKSHKASDPKARRRMAQEVLSLKILHSAGGKVPRVLDANTEKFEDQNSPLYFVMDYIEGQTLAKVVQTGPMSVRTAIQVALDLCSTLRVAVKEGIAHRDLKPENIIIRGLVPPDVVMVDFGLSFTRGLGNGGRTGRRSIEEK
jgi:eukaryotic-like serine/threonine-protein kinase